MNNIGDAIHECEFCGLHYYDEKLARLCLKWCTKNNSCNLRITEKSVERKNCKKYDYRSNNNNRNCVANIVDDESEPEKNFITKCNLSP